MPAEFESYRKKEFLCREEIADVFFNGETREHARFSVKAWLDAHQITRVTRVVKEVSTQPRQWVQFADLEASVVSQLPKDLLARPQGKKYSELLFLTEGKALRGPFSDIGVLFAQVSYASIASCLRGAGGCGRSIFESYGFANPDGTPIKVNTHQFRHWLNTLAQLAGVSPIDIAIWSGRKSVAQNEVYNHITQEQRLERLRSQVGDQNKAVGALSTLPKVIPIARADYAAAKIPTAHVTDFGYCVHDFSFEPCQLHRDCLSCNDHVCVKGDKGAEARLSLKLEETARLLGEARSALSQEEYGADRWVEHNASVLERLVALKSVLEDPSIENGAIIQLSNPTAPSRLKDALDSRVRLELPKVKGALKHEQETTRRIEIIKGEQASKGSKGAKP